MIRKLIFTCIVLLGVLSSVRAQNYFEWSNELDVIYEQVLQFQVELIAISWPLTDYL